MDEREAVPSVRNVIREPNPITPPACDEADNGSLLPAWPKACELALKRLDKLVTLEAKVLRGNRPEAVHAMRVTSRRLQEALDLIYAKPRPAEIRRLRRKVRRCRRFLSEVRNCDVLLQRAAARRSASRGRSRPVWETVTAFLEQRRETLFSKAVHKLTRVNLPEAYLQLRAQLVQSDAAPHSAHNGHLRDVTGEPSESAPSWRERLADELRQRWDYFERQAEETSLDDDATGLHPSRIAAKKLRYLIELATEFDVEGSRQALAGFKKLQATLGDWHDVEMSEAVLADIVGNARFIRENLAQAPAILKFIERDRKSKERLRRKGVEALRHVTGNGSIRQWIESLQSSETDLRSAHGS